MITDEDYLTIGLDGITDEQQKKVLLKWLFSSTGEHRKKIEKFIEGVKVGKSSFFAFLDAEKLNE